MVLDLEGSRRDLGVAEEVVEELGLEVGDTDALGETASDEGLHGGPCLLDGGLGRADLGLAVVVPAGRVSDGGVDVLEGDGEVNEVEVKAVDTPVSKLLANDGLYTVSIVEGVPKLGDDEEFIALDETLLDGAGNTLAAFDLVAVIYRRIVVRTKSVPLVLGGIGAKRHKMLASCAVGGDGGETRM